MVILIGGVGYAGKTYMAQQLLEKYKYPYLSIDHLKMGLYRADIGCGFTPTDDFEYIGEKIWPILKGIMMTAIENKQNMIIEGCYILPHLLNELEDEYLKKITSFHIFFSKSYIEKNFHSQILTHRSVIEARGYDDDEYTKDYICINERHKEICQNADAKCFVINENYQHEINKVYAWLDEKRNELLS